MGSVDVVSQPSTSGCSSGTTLYSHLMTLIIEKWVVWSAGLLPPQGAMRRGLSADCCTSHVIVDTPLSKPVSVALSDVSRILCHDDLCYMGTRGSRRDYG